MQFKIKKTKQGWNLDFKPGFLHMYPSKYSYSQDLNALDTLLCISAFLGQQVIVES